MRWLLVLICCWSGAAHAQLWGYVDATGVAHFSPRQVDSRYTPLLGVAAASRKVPGKTDDGTAMLTWLEISPAVKSVQPWLREAADQHGVDAELLKAVIAVESGYQRDAVSPRGAQGLMQITPETAARYASPAEQGRMLDPRINIHTGARMLADLIRRFGHIDAALAAWNAGEGAVRRAGNRVPPIDETQAHVHLVLELYWALLQQAQPAHAQRLKLHG